MNNAEDAPGIDSRQLPATVNLNGQKVREIREAMGLTQLYVAVAVGVTSDTISRWENRRYPSIKRENALKLAEILRVDISEILEQAPDKKEGHENNVQEEQACSCGETGAKASDGGSKDIRSHRNRIPMFFWAACIFIVVAAAAAAYLRFHPVQASLEITARRYLPEHSAPGQIFPVAIDLFIRPSAQRTVLITDGDDMGVNILKGMPAFTNRDDLAVKWIAQDKFGYKRFIYLAAIAQNASMNQISTFTGTITLKAGKATSVPIEGNNRIIAMPFCWADLNVDSIISDEEILDAYDLLSGVKGAENVLKEVEALWSAGRYKWDQQTHSFQPDHPDSQPPASK